jgi:hypothetical protein
MTEHQTKSPPGPAVDSSGGAVIDPTKNVLDLVHSAINRVDDVFRANMKRVDEVAAERVKRLEGEQRLHSEYHDKLMIAEQKRIDAIRATDVSAATLANERATQQADILARQVAQTAETLRTLVDSTAEQIAMQHEAFAKSLGDRITLLEKNQYEQQGKSVATSPMTEELIKEMRASREYRSTSEGKHDGMTSLWGYIIAFFTLVSMAISIGHILFGSG